MYEVTMRVAISLKRTERRKAGGVQLTCGAASYSPIEKEPGDGLAPTTAHLQMGDTVGCAAIGNQRIGDWHVPRAGLLVVSLLAR